MLSVNELLEKRATVWEGAKAFVETHQDKNGVLSAEDNAAYEKMEKEIVDLTQAIERAKRAEEFENKLKEPTSKPIVNKPVTDKPKGRYSFLATNEYNNALMAALRTGFKSISNVLSEGSDSEGGYLVPEVWEKGILETLSEENIMRSIATIMSTSGLTRFNIAASQPTASWIEESGAIKYSDATFEQNTIDAYKLHVAVKVTEELLYDESYDLRNYLTKAMGKAIANAEEDAFLNGDGNKKPTGLFNEGKGGTLSNTVTAVNGDDIIKLIYSLKRPYRKGASFLMNDVYLGKIRLLKDGQGNYLWQPSYSEGEQDRLAGYAVRTSQYSPLNAIAFGDFSNYRIADRGIRSFQQLNELYAADGQIAFVTKQRVDGKLLIKEAVQILKIENGAVASGE